MDIVQQNVDIRDQHKQQHIAGNIPEPIGPEGIQRCSDLDILKQVSIVEIETTGYHDTMEENRRQQTQ